LYTFDGIYKLKIKSKIHKPLVTPHHKRSACHRFHNHPQYPYKIKIKQLPKYITEKVRERGGGNEYIETYVGPKNIADALKQRHEDLQDLFT
jgi:hypothetical protein